MENALLVNNLQDLREVEHSVLQIHVQAGIELALMGNVSCVLTILRNPQMDNLANQLHVLIEMFLKETVTAEHV